MNLVVVDRCPWGGFFNRISVNLDEHLLQLSYASTVKVTI